MMYHGQDESHTDLRHPLGIGHFVVAAIVYTVDIVVVIRIVCYFGQRVGRYVVWVLCCLVLMRLACRSVSRLRVVHGSQRGGSVMILLRQVVVTLEKSSKIIKIANCF